MPHCVSKHETLTTITHFLVTVCLITDTVHDFIVICHRKVQKHDAVPQLKSAQSPDPQSDQSHAEYY